MLIALALVGCIRHNKQIEGSWTSKDPRFKNLLLVLKSDGTYTIHGTNYDPQHKPQDMTDKGSYLGGDTTLTLRSDSWTEVQPMPKPAPDPSIQQMKMNEPILNGNKQSPLMTYGNSAAMTWESPNAFFITDKQKGTQIELIRAK